MILNTTKTPFSNFTAMQRLALNGEMCAHEHVQTIDQFSTVFRKYINVKKVIVDGSDFVLANDILNYVSCPVVTLGIEKIADTGQVNFLLY